MAPRIQAVPTYPATHLRQNGSGRLFPYDPTLAKRGDMVPFTPKKKAAVQAEAIAPTPPDAPAPEHSISVVVPPAAPQTGAGAVDLAKAVMTPAEKPKRGKKGAAQPTSTAPPPPAPPPPVDDFQFADDGDDGGDELEGA